MELTLSEAARAVKMTKQGVLSAINKGRLSASKDANGQWRVDSAELFRVYPAVNTTASTSNNELTPDDTHLVRELTAKLEAAADVRQLLEARVEGLERERDAWQRQAEALMRALPAGKTPGRPQEAPGGTKGTGGIEPATATSENVSEGRSRLSWWRRLWMLGG
jgi:hypothetical protein